MGLRDLVLQNTIILALTLGILLRRCLTSDADLKESQYFTRMAKHYYLGFLICFSVSSLFGFSCCSYGVLTTCAWRHHG